MRFYLLLFLLTCKLFASTLHLDISANPSRLNPILATDSASSEIADFIFSALVKYDENGTKIIGDLAKDFYFENNTTLIFNLRKDVLWHDGVRFSAEDVLFTYNLINDASVVSPYTSTFRQVKSVEVLDPYRLRVIYKKPYFKALETWMMGILPKHLLENEKNIMGAAFNTAPVGTGPYRLSVLEHSKAIKLIAFDKYYEGQAKIQNLSFHVIADPMTRFLMLKSGELDIGSLEAMQFERQVDEDFFKTFKSIEQISHSYTYLGFNLRLAKFQDPRVRKALSFAIDRQELVDILFLKHAQVCTGPFLPGGPSFNADAGRVTPDKKRAKALLKAAGYDDKHPLSFEIATSNSSSIRPYAAEILQQQLAAIGVKVTLRVMEWQAFLNMVVFPRKFDTVLLGWSLSLSPDPYLLWHSDNDKPGGFNFIGYHNAHVDSLIETMQGTIERKKLATIQKEIFKEIVDDDPYLFLYIPNAITVVNKRIKNIRPTINGIWYNQIEWEKEVQN